MNDTDEGNAMRGVVIALLISGAFYAVLGVALVVML
jgi:hypothetical protein